MKANVALLQTKWREALAVFAVNEALVDRVFADLVVRYGENGRHYHNLQHIHNVLHTIETLQALATDFTAVQLAAWFHDVIYQVQLAGNVPSNETQSADYAATMLSKMNIPAQIVALIHQLICATQLHSPVPAASDFHILLDADLAILAADCGEYDQYAQAIRREYDFVPDAQFRNGRCQVLQSFLDRDQIFLTQPMFQQSEEAARLNIQREIDKLRAENV